MRLAYAGCAAETKELSSATEHSALKSSTREGLQTIPAQENVSLHSSPQEFSEHGMACLTLTCMESHAGEMTEVQALQPFGGGMQALRSFSG